MEIVQVGIKKPLSDEARRKEKVNTEMSGADPGFFAGGGRSTTAVYSGRLRLPRRRGGGLGLINIRLRYIASIEYSERFVVVAIVKKFVEKKIGGREQGGHDPPPLDPRLNVNVYLNHTPIPSPFLMSQVDHQQY